MIERTKSGFVLRYGALELPFAIEERRRSTVSIAVHPDRRLEVVAPEGADVEKVLSRVEGKARWIARQWRFFAPALAREGEARYGFFAGETHWFLGRAYRLKIALPQKDECEGVTQEGRFFWVVTLAPDDAARVEKLLTGWYRGEAHRVFAQWMDNCLASSRSLELAAPPEWEVRQMHKRWGSCTSGGKILLALDLVKMPVDCIEYVLFHELCHLKHSHHGPEFYRLLERFLPDWKARKAKLEEWGEKI